MAVRAIVLVALALALCVATGMPAHADGTREPVEVARDGRYALEVQDEDEQICLNIDGPGGDGFSCFDSEGGAVMRQEVRPGVVYVGAVVLASVVRVEFQRAGRPLGGGPTVAGEKYQGQAKGTLRFVLARVAAGAPEDGLRVRGYDAAGALVSVSAPRDSELVLARRRALSGRSSGVRWSVFDDRLSKLTPSVLDPAHETIVHCVRVSLHGRFNGEGLRRCSADSPRVQFEFPRGEFPEAEAEDRCRPRFRLLHGVVPGTVTEVSALLGDGSVRTARPVALEDGQRAYALGIAPGRAVRSVTLRKADGDTEVHARRLAPLSVDCASSGGSAFGNVIGLFSLDNLPSVTPTGPSPRSPARRRSVSPTAPATRCASRSAIGRSRFSAARSSRRASVSCTAWSTTSTPRARSCSRSRRRWRRSGSPGAPGRPRARSRPSPARRTPAATRAASGSRSGRS